MSNDVMTAIDSLAEKFFETRDKKYFDSFAQVATPTIKNIASKSCKGSSWDVDELFSILLADMWRLFQRWVPEEGKKFHWLMLRQLRNKTINYVHAQVGRKRKICPICGARQQSRENEKCSICKSLLRLSDIIISEPFEPEVATNPNYLAQLANVQLVEKLLDAVRDDPKTHKILTMLLEGESKSVISAEVNIAQNALNNRLKKCQTIIHKLMKEKIS